MTTLALTETDSAPAQQTAVALAYHEGSAAPKVVAKGRGLLAEAIIARAREAGVYVHESPALVVGSPGTELEFAL